MTDKPVRNLLLTFFFCKMTKIINFLTNIVVKKKKMCYNKFKLRNRNQKGTIMWALGFVPLVIMFYLYHTQRVKKLENKIKRIEQKQKGNKEMSRILKELIGKKPVIVGQLFGTDNWEVVDVDEEWVKLRRVDKKGKEKFKLQRIEDIQTVEFDGE
ncbi:hypothetical protein [Streptococcus oralis]|uniref:Uncharacterized protein n=1 Tax=Streptococcus oralis TaxID=1303 RepID=A0A4Q2FRF0_STROR|nr:hypothetical protein [Streptococcus oralis]RXX21736.1 hypothetical protein DF216_04810 [Streptococcus oralis]